jgi:hypothetical protein
VVLDSKLWWLVVLHGLLGMVSAGPRNASDSLILLVITWRQV